MLAENKDEASLGKPEAAQRFQPAEPKLHCTFFFGVSAFAPAPRKTCTKKRLFKKASQNDFLLVRKLISFGKVLGLKALLLFLVAVAAVMAVYLGYSAEFQQAAASPTPRPLQNTGFVSTPSEAPFASPSVEPIAQAEERVIKLKLPAAASEGGVLAELTVVARPAAVAGSPRNWIPVPDPANPIVNNDTQVSLSVAAEYARAFAEGDASVFDLFYSLTAPSVAVGGRSAGAAAAIVGLALLEGKQLRNDTLITGALEPDGRITRVGRILDKARAVKEAGYSLFLVPVGESIDSVSRTMQNQSCTTEYVGGTPFTSCRTQSVTVTESVNVSEETGVQLIEVANVSQAYDIMRVDLQ